MIGRTVAGSLIALGVASSGFASAVPIPEVVVPTSTFTERLDPNILSTGGLVVGVMMGDPGRAVLDQIVTVSGIRPGDQALCIAIKHVDGAYTAGFTVANPRRGPTVRFRVPSRLITGLGAKAGALAILARAGTGPRCTRADPILPATWGRQPITAAGFALVNDHQSDYSFARIGAQRVRQCVAMSGLVGTGRAFRSYQVGCPIDMAGPCGSEAPLVVQFTDSGNDSEIRPLIRRVC